MNAKIIGISVDSPFANAAFSKQYSLEFDLLSDFERKVINDYDVLFTGLGGVEGYTCANRAVFIIKNGIITYKWEAPSPGAEPDYEDIKGNL